LTYNAILEGFFEHGEMPRVTGYAPVQWYNSHLVGKHYFILITARRQLFQDILSFSGKWMELENIILSEVSQVQKAKNCMFSLM
jgi:hypothetical protein